MDTTLNNAATKKKQPLVVEIVGPAGAGKTTLSQTLSQRRKGILVCEPPFFRKLRDSPFFIRYGLLMLPTFLRIFVNKNGNRYLNKIEIVRMVILKGWHYLLSREMMNSGKNIVLDQGPIFLLAELRMLGPEVLNNQSTKKWWESIYEQWATTLSMVILLDTSNRQLLKRIRSRGKWHEMKDKDELEVFAFLTQYRIAYEQVISILTSNLHSPTVLRFDTAKKSVDEIVNKLTFEFPMKNIEAVKTMP